MGIAERGAAVGVKADPFRLVSGNVLVTAKEVSVLPFLVLVPPDASTSIAVHIADSYTATVGHSGSRLSLLFHDTLDVRLHASAVSELGQRELGREWRREGFAIFGLVAARDGLFRALSRLQTRGRSLVLGGRRERPRRFRASAFEHGEGSEVLNCAGFGCGRFGNGRNRYDWESGLGFGFGRSNERPTCRRRKSGRQGSPEMDEERRISEGSEVSREALERAGRGGDANGERGATAAIKGRRWIKGRTRGWRTWLNVCSPRGDSREGA
jgi:hypothetical protein